MIDKERPARLKRGVVCVKDRTEILGVSQSHTRGHDRSDVDLLTAAYNPDGAKCTADRARRSTLDFMMTTDASLMQSPYISEARYIKSERDAMDLSYQRPLSRDVEVEKF